MKAGNWRLQSRKRDRVQPWGPRSKKSKSKQYRVFLGVLRKGLGHQVILDLPQGVNIGFAREPGTRIWFTVLGSTLLVTGQPQGQRGERRYSSRLVRSYLPLKLLLQNRERRTS
jgi:hypothetical protein